MSRLLPRLSRSGFANDLFDAAFHNPERLFRHIERDLGAIERHFDSQVRNMLEGHTHGAWPSSSFFNRGSALRGLFEDAHERSFYNSNEYSELADKYNKEHSDLADKYNKEHSDLVEKYNKEYSDMRNNYVKQLNALRETYQKQAQQLYDKHVEQAEKDAAAGIPRVEEDPQGRYEARVQSRSVENGRVRESVERHVKRVNGKSVEQVITTKYLADGTREVHEVTKDENGTREKTTKYAAENKHLGAGESQTVEQTAKSEQAAQ